MSVAAPMSEKPSDVSTNTLTIPQTDPDTIESTESSEPLTTRAELVAYAMYYFANNSSGPFAYTPTALQNILNQAGWDAHKGRGSTCATTNTSSCMVDFGSSAMSVDVIVLINQGAGFGLQTVVFLFLGGFADYGKSGNYILLVLTLATWAVQLAWLGVHDGSKYNAAFAISILASLGYQGCQSFWQAIFPMLARNLPEERDMEKKMAAGDVEPESYYKLDEYYRNKILNYSFAMSMLGMALVLSVSIGILFSLHSRESDANNNWGMSVIIAWATIVWIVFGLPWFFLSKTRVNQRLPKGVNYLTLPFKQLAYVFKSLKTLKQTALYLVTYWVLSDSLNTSIYLETILQNDVISYDMISVQYLWLIQSFMSAVGIGTYWFVQKKFALSTKTMFIINTAFITLVPLYGLIGAWTDKLGFHNLWEMYVVQGYFGLFVAPYYAYSATMMSTVTPRGKEYVFFAIFSVFNKTASVVGPLASAGIIDSTGNTNIGFSFPFAMCAIALVLAFFLNEEKSRQECKQFLADEIKSTFNDVI